MHLQIHINSIYEIEIHIFIICLFSFNNLFIQLMYPVNCDFTLFS